MYLFGWHCANVLREKGAYARCTGADEFCERHANASIPSRRTDRACEVEGKPWHGNERGDTMRDRTVAVSGCSIGVAWCSRQTEETQSETYRRSERRWGTARVLARLSNAGVAVCCGAADATLVIYFTTQIEPAFARRPPALLFGI